MRGFARTPTISAVCSWARRAELRLVFVAHHRARLDSPLLAAASAQCAVGLRARFAAFGRVGADRALGHRTAVFAFAQPLSLALPVGRAKARLAYPTPGVPAGIMAECRARRSPAGFGPQRRSARGSPSRAQADGSLRRRKLGRVSSIPRRRPAPASATPSNALVAPATRAAAAAPSRPKATSRLPPSATAATRSRRPAASRSEPAPPVAIRRSGAWGNRRAVAFLGPWSAANDPPAAT